MYVLICVLRNATVVILRCFTFSDEMGSALALMKPFILGLASVDAAKILKSFTFSSDQITALTQIVNFVLMSPSSLLSLSCSSSFSISSSISFSFSFSLLLLLFLFLFLSMWK